VKSNTQLSTQKMSPQGRHEKEIVIQQS